MADNTLFSRLQRLFSTNVIIRRTPKGIRVTDTESIQSYSDLATNFMKSRGLAYFHSTAARYGYDIMANISAQRVTIFRDYELMEQDPIIASVLDIAADECTVKNEFGDILTIKSDNEKIKQALENLFYDILNINFNCWPWIRNMVKYGDHFLKLEIAEKLGIINVIPVSPYEVQREEGFDVDNPYRVRFVMQQVASENRNLDSFEMAHFRMLSDTNFLPYGKCLSQHTIITTKNGPKLIKDISIGDEVYSWDTTNKKVIPTKVLDKIMSGIKKTYEVKTAHRKIYATAEHPILTSEGIYKQVKDLTLNDYLILPIINDINEITYPKLLIEETDDYKFDNKLVIIDEKLLKDNFKELVKFFGFMLGDGWVCGNKVAFSMGDRLDKSQKYVDFIKKLGLSFRIDYEDTSRATCTINSGYFRRILQQLDFRTGTENKIVPSWIWNLTLEYKLEFLLGFSDADGCDIDDNTFQLGTINEKLIDDLRQIAIECGLSTTKKWTTHTNGWTGKGCTMHLFTYKFKSRDFIRAGENYHIEKIRGINEHIKEEVYDIQVDNEFHNFIAGSIIVHNSYIEPARRVWKQMMLMEDAMLIHRIMRAPEKRIFRIDVGNVAPNEVETFMKNMINKIKKVPYVDPRTGEYNLKFNMMNMTEDFFIPVRGGDSGTSIDTLAGLEYNAIDDINYLLNKLLAALKVPKAFLGYEEGVGGKATLAAEDVRFARTIERIQRIFISELKKIAIVHLYVQGFKDEEITDFTLELTNPSTILEQERVSLWQEKISLTKDMIDSKMFSKEWVYKNLWNLTETDIKELSKKILEDVKTTFRITQIESEGNDPFVTNQTFGTPHDLTILQQRAKEGNLNGEQKKLDFSKLETNSELNYTEHNPDTGEKERDPEDDYGEQNHIDGKDPIGGKQATAPVRRDTKTGHVYKGSPLSMEAKKRFGLNLFDQKFGDKSKQVISESLTSEDTQQKDDDADVKGTFLDDKNLIDM